MELKDNILSIHPSIYIEIANTLSSLDSFDNNIDESSTDMPSIIDYEGPTKHDESEIEYVEWDHKKQSWEKSNK